MSPCSPNPTKQLNIKELKNPICQKPHRATVYSWTVEHISFQTSKCWHFNATRFNIRSPSNPTATTTTTSTCSHQFQVLLEKSRVWLQTFSGTNLNLYHINRTKVFFCLGWCDFWFPPTFNYLGTCCTRWRLVEVETRSAPASAGPVMSILGC